MAAREAQRFELPETESGPAPVSYERAERRTFGLAPHALVAALAVLGVAAAAALLATAPAVIGLLLLAAALLLGALYLEQARSCTSQEWLAVGRTEIRRPDDAPT